MRRARVFPKTRRRQRLGALLSLLLACWVFLAASKVAPVPKTDEVEIKVTPPIAISPARLNILVKVKNPQRFWCPQIIIDIDDGAYYHSQQSDCDPSEESLPHDSWIYTHIPSKGSRERIFNAGEHSIKIVLIQGRDTFEKVLTVSVL